MKWKVLLAIAVVGMFVMPMMPAKVKADNTTLATHYWHDKKLIWWMWGVAKYANDDEDMRTSNTYQELRNFFHGCSTIEQFYNRINNSIIDAQSYSEADTTSRKLSVIIDKILEKAQQGKNASLLCYQQAILFAGGVKAMFSEWNGERYVLKSGYSDFTFYFNVKFEGYPQGHIQLVIDKWNGQDWFYYKGRWYNRWEADTWENNNRPWDSDEGWKDNSKMWTDTSSATSTNEKINEEYNWTEIENVISISGDNHWYEFWIEDNLINDYYNYLRENEK